jgi:hypothetical protein
VLKELIYHGHALILLDGLDEIREVGRRKEIVDFVKNFIDEYVRAFDFISPFDDKIFNINNSFSYVNVIETQPPSKSGGNQIVVTSRIVGYQFSPLTGPFIVHYLLSLMNHKQGNEFAKKWRTQVERSVLDILVKEKVKVNEKTVENLWKKRCDAVEAMFEGDSELLMSNPSLLSLISTIIFQSPDEFCPKSRVEVYNHATQVALHSWTSKQSIFSKEMLTSFLIDLATYLHLNSPSGLIDEFDIEHLCCLVLQQQGLSNDRNELREYTNTLISLLESDIGIVTERGLKIFGFQHLSFQEYFVALSLVSGSSIEEIVKRILSFTINPRFRESLLLAIGWISLKKPFDKYDKFCNLLVTTTNNYSIPFGTLLFFDAINDLQRLPSNKVIFIALNNLLDHSSNLIRTAYLISNLSKLPQDIIKEWMNLRLKDEKCLFKFSQCFPMHRNEYPNIPQYTRESISPVVYQQLWLLHGRSLSAEFVIDQTLRRTMTSNDLSDQIFNKDLSLYFQSNNISISNIHPLIASVIITVCGGIYLKTEENVIKIDFSPKQMHRESSILASILEYLDNNEDHSIKIQTLIQQYENVLRKCLPSNTSIDIVDAFIALICLQGVSQPLIYQKYDGYQALPLAINRLKQNWFYLEKKFRNIGSIRDMSFIKSEVESIMNVFFSQSNQSDEQRMFFSVACASAWKKLRMWDLSCELDLRMFFRNKVERDLQCVLKSIHFRNNEKLDEIAKNIHSYQMLQEKPLFFLTFLPQSLQKLYYCTTIFPTNNDSLPLVVLLSQCLTNLDDVNQNNFNSCLALSMLHSLLKEHNLENYASVVFQEKYSGNKSFNEFSELFDPFIIDQPIGCEMLINVESQRICEIKMVVQNQQKDLRLFAASISLARLFQARYRSREYKAIKQISLTSVESKEVLCAIRNIIDPILRIIAFSIILEMKDPLIFDEERKDQLRYEIIILLQYLLPHLSLTTSTLLFVRCHATRQFFLVSFRYMANIIGQKLNDTSTNKQSQDQEAAFIALRQLNNPDLSQYLSEFAKQTTNLSDLLHFNSTMFYQYLTSATSFDSLNNILLLSMYLVELSFDSQILKMYTQHDHPNNILPLQELKQLWNDSAKGGKIMTIKVAVWITDRLQIASKNEIHQIIKYISICPLIEIKVLTVIEKWLDYRMDKVLNIFAHYAALQLLIEGSNISGLIDIINEMFRIDRKFCSRSILERLFNSKSVDLIIARQILVTLHQNVPYSSDVSVWIDRKETIKLILHLELERITSNVRHPSETSTRPFLLMIKGCSGDLQLYLAEHLRTFVNTQNELENTIIEEYVAVVVKWIIEIYIDYDMRENCSIELYKYIFSLLHNQRLPQVQKAILNGLNSVFFSSNTEKKNIFLQDDAITNLEKVICSWNTYREDIVAICLLAYGDGLLKLQQFQITPNVSDNIKNILNILFGTSSSEIISIRARFCLIFAEHSDIKYNTITKWFSDKSYITPEKRYKMLLQQTLYNVRQWPLSNDENDNGVIIDYEDKYEFKLGRDIEIADHIETHSAELMNTFVIDLYNYLCNKDDNYLCDPAPDYVEIALKVVTRNLGKFCNAVEKSDFGKKEFKKKLCLYCKNNPKDIKSSIELYMVFGILTVEFVNMLEQIPNDTNYLVLFDQYLKQVSDREAIEKLFQLLDSKTGDYTFWDCLMILKVIANTRDVSLVEIHRRILLTSNMFYDNSEKWQRNEELIFNLLLSLSCIENRSLLRTENELFAEDDIEEKYEKEIVDLDQNLSLFLRTNSFVY